MKSKIILLVLVFLSAILQLSVFSSWSLSIFGRHTSPQIFPVLAIFLLFEFDEEYLWWFTFAYYLVYDLILRPDFPGLAPLLVVAALLVLKYLRRQFFRKSIYSRSLFFVLFSSFYFVLIYGDFQIFLIAVQVLSNLMLLLFFYPILYIFSRALKSGASAQLSLKI